MSHPRKKGGIPDRWLDYKAVGKRLPGTRFVAFKVPLKWNLNNHLPSSDVFGHWELLDVLKRENQELGLIIDLTFTTRYYKAHDVPEPLHCVKIFTAGHEVPSDATILSFKRAVRRFLRENSDNDKLVGVHCTHGLNRTGYLICRYLIDVDGVDPREAIALFNSSRGHDIERKNYLKDLLSGPKRSNEGIEESEQDPVAGTSTHRPVYSEVNADKTEERPTLSQVPAETATGRYKKHHRSRPRREGHAQSLGPSPDWSGPLPTPGRFAFLPFPAGGPGLLPFPAFPPARHPPYNPYPWVRETPPPQPQYRWSGPSHQQRPGPGPGPGGHGYSWNPPGPSHWSNGSGSYSGEWDSPRARHDHREKPYDYPA